MRTRFIIIPPLLLLFLLPGGSKAQDDHYWVRFTDKDQTPYSIGQPEAFLSKKAVRRREEQGIPVDEKDLPIDPSYRDSILSHPEVELLHSSKWFNGITVECTDSLHMDTIDAHSFVKSSDRVKLLRSPSPLSPSKERAPSPKSSEEREGHEGRIEAGKTERQLGMIGLQQVLNLGHRGKGVRIAVLDAGFPQVDQMKAFAHIFEEKRYIGGFDAVEGDHHPFRAHGHGRTVLSILAGKKEGEFIGAAPDAEYILCRTENASSEFRIEEQNWIAAAEHADSAGADILSTSLGYTSFDDSSQSYSPSDMDGNTSMITRGADIAASRGMLVVNSAGNSGSQDWGIIGAPADGDSVLAVGAVDSSEELSDFSSRGPSADGRIKPDLVAMGEGTAFIGGDGEVYNGNGTSLSTPLISGAAACLWGRYPELEAMELFQKLLESAHRYEDPDNGMGYGIPNLFRAYLEEKGISLEEKGKGRILNLAPNPYRDRIEVQFHTGGAEKLELKWWGTDGKLLHRATHPLPEAEQHELILEPPSVPREAGVHFLEFRWSDGKSTVKKLLQEGQR